MPVLLLVAAVEALAGAVLLGARGAGEVPAFLLLTAVATAALAVALSRIGPPPEPALRLDALPPPPDDPWPGLRDRLEGERAEDLLPPGALRL